MPQLHLAPGLPSFLNDMRKRQHSRNAEQLHGLPEVAKNAFVRRATQHARQNGGQRNAATFSRPFASILPMHIYETGHTDLRGNADR
ncbi:hypothetical protein HPB50_023416 [Hyalomma asiaticum]|uniref:Uncharacterized protein n=1 Tax=Hyalomma asiaticum TaxID=266040 RepID=A0ACB7S620_HYAAI|nr:hypothetical protein HPB50_023416 [Hyalomma asiaticum]